MHLPIIRTSFSVICTLCRWLKDELSIQVDMDSIRASFEEKMKKKEGKEKGGGGNQSRKTGYGPPSSPSSSLFYSLRY
jgi:hypothetical protein